MTVGMPAELRAKVDARTQRAEREAIEQFQAHEEAGVPLAEHLMVVRKRVWASLLSSGNSRDAFATGRKSEMVMLAFLLARLPYAHLLVSKLRHPSDAIWDVQQLPRDAELRSRCQPRLDFCRWVN